MLSGGCDVCIILQQTCQYANAGESVQQYAERKATVLQASMAIVVERLKAVCNR